MEPWLPRPWTVMRRLAAGGQERAGVCADAAGRERKDVLRQGDRRLGDEAREPGFDHPGSTAPELLGGLEERNERAVPGRAVRREQPRGARQARDVHVVAAGVRDGHDVAGGVGLLDRAGVRKARFFLHRQGVHVRAHEHRRAVAVAQDADNPGRADLVVHLVPGIPQVRCRGRSRVHFLVGELRVLVERAVEILLPRLDPVLTGQHLCGGRASGGARGTGDLAWVLGHLQCGPAASVPCARIGGPPENTRFTSA
jgi:hypothetical protein